jgi:hypothetical protein
MVRDRNPYGFTSCAICDDVTASAKVPPVCHDCLYLVSRGSMKPARVSRSVADALAALTAYRARLGAWGPPTTGERLRWCLDYCRARGAYLRRHNGTLPPIVRVPHTTTARWRHT